MSIVDFKEIPPANGSDGTQDTFELFCRDLLSNLSFRIISEPNRGADGGLDFLAIETRPGKYNNTEIRWLISCKHKAHSGLSVNPTDESNISDRVKTFKADGFLGFYSTLISSGLNRTIDSYKDNMEILIFDKANIEAELLKEPNKTILRRYFPESYNKWVLKTPRLVKMYSKYEPLYCEVCGKDLLQNEGNINPEGIVAFVNDTNSLADNKEKVFDVYTACKGRCDSILENRWYKRNGITGWKDISDLANPLIYISWIMAILNELNDNGVVYEGESFSKLKNIINKMSQLVYREPTEEEKRRYLELRQFDIF